MTNKSEIKYNLMRRHIAGDYLRRSAERLPDKTALVFNDKRFTYREFNARVNRLSNALLGLGLKKGDTLTTFTQNCYQQVIALWACFKTGIIWSPANYMFRKDELVYHMNHSETTILFVEDELLDHVKEVQDNFQGVKYFGVINNTGCEIPEGWLELNYLFSEKFSDHEPEVIIEGDDVAAVGYTGGTTSAPKAILITNDIICSTIIHWLSHSQTGGCMEESDVWLMNIPLYHTAALCLFVPFIVIGATIIGTHGTEPAEILETIQREKVTYLGWPPTIYVGLLQMPLEKYDLSSLRVCGWFGGAMPIRVMEKWMDLIPQAKFFAQWSQTESFCMGTLYHFTRENLPKAGNVIGKAENEVSLRIVDENEDDVPVGEVGEIILRTPGTMMGYYKNPEKTDEAFKNGWLHTGDIGYMDEDGFIYFFDRKGDMVKSGGVNISCVEVEDVINAHPDVEVSAVFGLPDPYWTEALTAYVVPKSGSLTKENIQNYCEEKLAKYKIPKTFLLGSSSELPISPSGKILRKQLREKYKESSEDK